MEGITKAFKKLIEFISTHKMPILAMASIVVCITTYSLILPALTLTENKAQEQGGISLTKITEDAASDSDAAENSDSQEEDKDEETPVIEYEHKEDHDNGNVQVDENTDKKSQEIQGSKEERQENDEAEEESKDSEEEPKYKDMVLSSVLNDKEKVTVKIGKDAKVPEGSSLVVYELLTGKDAEKAKKLASGKESYNSENTEREADITEIKQDEYDSYINETEKVLGWENGKASDARMLDIKIVDKDGKKVTIAAPVDVKIELIDNAVKNDLSVVHFADVEYKETDADNNAADNQISGEYKNRNEVIRSGNINAADANKVQDVSENSGKLSFEADGFSVYVIVGTTIEKTVLTSDGNEYKVRVTFGPETGIPENADLSVKELTEDSNAYESYVANTENALGKEEGSTGYIRLFDIKIVDKNDPKIKYQPAEGTSVDVKIELEDKDTDKETAKSTKVVHFADGSETGDVVDAKTKGQSVSFEAPGFSIYAIVDDTKIITVNFYDGEGNFLTSEYVKKNGDDIEDLYSPGFELDYGESFYGWATSQDATSGLDIDALNASFKANWNTYSEDTPVNYYAVVKKVYVVTFNKYDDEGNLIVLRTVNIPLDQQNKTITIPGDLGAEVGNDFQGWLGQDGTIYTEGQSFTVGSHFTFFMKERGRNWLVFDSNAGGPGSGATYTPPQLIYGDGVVTKKPEDPTRTGYSFIGWNTSPDGSGTWWYKTDGSVPNRFGSTISSDTTLYAQWEGDITKYYVLYWQQDASDDAGLSDDQKHYSYVGSREATARTGDTVSTVNSDRNKGGTEGYEHYHYNGTKSQTTTTVAADGTTTLNVYYDLDEYTLSFQVTGYIYTPTTSTSGTQYGYYNGNYVTLYYNNGTWYRTRSWSWGGYSYSNPYYGTRYTRSGGYNTWSTIKEITALYGHNISDQFPIVGTNGITYNHGERWDPQNDRIWHEVMVYIDTMPDRNVTFHLDTSSASTKTMNYRVQALPGETGTTTWNGEQFILYNSIDANYNGVTEEDYVELEGFTKYGVDPSYTYNNGNYTYYVDYQGSRTAASTVNFYYLRKKYDIHLVSVGDGRLEYDLDDIYYQQDLSQFGPDGSDYHIPENGLDGYAFAGWYTDESCAPGTEFNFNTTMPNHDITLYAKWEEQRCRVVLDPNAPTGEYSFANNQSLSFRMDYNEKLSGANITGSAVSRPGYKLDGWYTESGTLWNFDTLVNDSVEGVNSDYQSTDDWANNVYGDNDGQHTNVKNILKLKAKWKLNIQENSVYVIYKVNDVYYTYNASGDLQTIIPVDDTAYVLQDDTTDVSFQTAPAPTGYNDGYVFRDWALLNSNGEKSGTTYLDGEHATVDQQYFVTQTIIDDEGHEGTLRYVVFEAQFDPNENRATAVVYNGNGGTSETGGTTIGENYLVNKAFNILGEDAFEREGYTFVEWNTKADGTGTSFEAGAEVAADNLEGTAWDDVGKTNNLYAIWEINKYTVTVKKIVDGETATDKEFAFAASANGDYSIDESFNLVNGGEETFTEVPYGTALTFAETPANGYSIQNVTAKQTTNPDKTPLEESEYIDLGGADGKQYTIKGDVVITYINEKAKEQKLHIHKIGDDAEDGLAGAIFNLTSSDAEGFDNMTDLTSMTGTDLGYLPGNDDVDETLFVIPVGTYTLTETEAPQYYDGLLDNVTLNVTYEGITFEKGNDEDVVELSGPDNDGEYTLMVSNKRKLGNVTIIKNVVGTDDDEAATYNFSQTGLTGDQTFGLRGKDDTATDTAVENQKVYENVPYGTTFSVAEADTYTDFDTTIVISNEATPVTTPRLTTGNVTVDADDVTITYTNTRNNQPVKIVKLDDGETPLAGAKFSMYTEEEYAKDPDDRIALRDDLVSAAGTGEIDLDKLAVGTYYLVETEAPAGYIPLKKPVVITSGSERVSATLGTDSTAANIAAWDANDQYWKVTVHNNPGVELPHTGGLGVNWIYLTGILLVLMSGAALVIKRRVSDR